MFKNEEKHCSENSEKMKKKIEVKIVEKMKKKIAVKIVKKWRKQL